MRFLLGSCCCFSIILWKRVKLLSYSNLPSNTFVKLGKNSEVQDTVFPFCSYICLKMELFRHVTVLCLSHVPSVTHCWNPSSREGSLMLAQPFEARGPQLNPVGGGKESLLSGWEEEEPTAHRSDSQAVSQGWTGKTRRRRGGQERPALQLWTLCRPVRQEEKQWELKWWFCPAWHRPCCSSRQQYAWKAVLGKWTSHLENTTLPWCLPASAGERAGCVPLLLPCMAWGFPFSLVAADPSLMGYHTHVCCSPAAGVWRSSRECSSAKKKGRERRVERSNVINCFRLFS